jgi:hypothetical protein
MFLNLSYFAKAFMNYSHIVSPRLNTANIDYSAIAALEGWSYEAASIFNLASGGVKYFSFQVPAGPCDRVIGLQARYFKADLPDVDLEILWGAGIAGGTPLTIFSNNNVDGPSVVAFDEDPTIDETGAILREADFIPSGAPANKSAGQIGANNSFRAYRCGENFVVKITNNANTTNRIKLGYSWLEVPSYVLKE